MKWKTSAVWADGTFESNTAPLTGPLDICARRAAELGYDALSLTVNRPEDLDVARVQAVMRQYGLAVSGLATGRIYTVDGLSLGTANQEQRLAAVHRMLAHAQTCACLGGAKLIIGAIRGWVHDAGDTERYKTLFRDSIEMILAGTEKLGVPVVLEAISHIDSDMYCSVTETAAFIRSFHSSQLQLQIDSLHLYNNDENFYPAITELESGMIGQVDISDVNRTAPDGRHFDFPLLLRALKQCHYQDYLVFEYKETPPENAAAKGLDYIKSLSGMIG